MEKRIIEEKFLRLLHQYMQLGAKIDFLEVSRTEFMMMELISHGCQKEYITVSDLADIMKVSSPAVSRTVRSLSEDGYIEKKPMPMDRRNTFLTLTPLGEQVVKKSENRLGRIADEVIDNYGIEKSHDFADKCAEMLNFFETAINREREKEK